jgi:hypothetical protein
MIPATNVILSFHSNKAIIPEHSWLVIAYCLLSLAITLLLDPLTQYTPKLGQVQVWQLLSCAWTNHITW